jgi:hypothetical protein
MTTKRKQKLVTVVTSLGYLTTTPAIAKKVVEASKTQTVKPKRKKRKPKIVSVF